MSCSSARIRRAVDRDVRDTERLQRLHNAVSETLDKIAPYVYPLEHPLHKWQPGDLVDVLHDVLEDIRHARFLLTGPVYLEDDDGAAAA